MQRENYFEVAISKAVIERIVDEFNKYKQFQPEEGSTHGYNNWQKGDITVYQPLDPYFKGAIFIHAYDIDFSAGVLEGIRGGFDFLDEDQKIIYWDGNADDKSISELIRFFREYSQSDDIVALIPSPDNLTFERKASIRLSSNILSALDKLFYPNDEGLVTIVNEDCITISVERRHIVNGDDSVNIGVNYDFHGSLLGYHKHLFLITLTHVFGHYHYGGVRGFYDTPDLIYNKLVNWLDTQNKDSI